MKKIAFLLATLCFTVAANAQFEQGKGYLGASLSGLDLSYNGTEKGHITLQGKLGYFLADYWMVTGQFGYEKQKDVPYRLSIGPGIRYYIEQNGLYMGASTLFKHGKNYNDFMPSIQIGYAFFLGRTVTLEPEIYYEHSFKDHSNYSTAGIRVGVGVYLFKDQYQKKK
jgi:hypothetical protein